MIEPPIDERYELAAVKQSLTTDERKLAEQAYTLLAHDYEANPIGSRDWVIFFTGWRNRAELSLATIANSHQPAVPSVKRHQWEDDHCVKCGDADWYAGPECSEIKVAPDSMQPAVPDDVAKDAAQFVGDCCPECGAPEQDAMSPRTVYFCGSSDYDRRIGTLHQTSQCLENTRRAAAILSATDAEVKK